MAHGHMSKYCLVPMTTIELIELVGSDFVKNFQAEMDPILQPLRKHIAKGRPLSLGKELWEYAVADAIVGAEWNGAGHSLIDVKIGDEIGIDVKSVSKQTKSTNTTEASMFQNFNQDAKTHFQNNDAKGVWDIHVAGWLTKISTIKEYYLLGIIRDKTSLDCSLCGFKVVNTAINYLTEHCNFTGKSIKISGLADPDFINIRYYNSKSRLEIMFTKKCWTDPNYSLPIYKF
jgi:hypothetical protein